MLANLYVMVTEWSEVIGYALFVVCMYCRI